MPATRADVVLNLRFHLLCVCLLHPQLGALSRGKQAVSHFHGYSLPVGMKGGFLLSINARVHRCGQKDVLIIPVDTLGPVTGDREMSHWTLEEGLSRVGMGFCYQRREGRLVCLPLERTGQRDVGLG